MAMRYEDSVLLKPVLFSLIINTHNWLRQHTAFSIIHS
jgi:hypothetical protein